MRRQHHPPHLYLDDTNYFLTARVHNNQRILSANEKKRLILDLMEKVFLQFQFKLHAWVVLSNHYHIEFKTRLGKDLSKAIQYIHGRGSYEINMLDNQRGRKIFQNYWDHCLRDKGDFYKHFNYIHHNPVKHGYVSEMGQYPLSSFKYWCDKKGEEWVQSCFRDYPIVDFTLLQDDDL